ncbi:hypothetical protein AWZ03_012057 [Drosophila navojoa]|uniref:Uncharacterized protein n=1 Tax=Drosophila navojoa TaxID=7232 RepID=A0A484AYL1_DRONA|nr:hypothetical protein AWZ03_012057 [Drosophila navojoa]
MTMHVDVDVDVDMRIGMASISHQDGISVSFLSTVAFGPCYACASAAGFRCYVPSSQLVRSRPPQLDMPMSMSTSMSRA